MHEPWLTRRGHQLALSFEGTIMTGEPRTRRRANATTFSPPRRDVGRSVGNAVRPPTRSPYRPNRVSCDRPSNACMSTARSRPIAK